MQLCQKCVAPVVDAMNAREQSQVVRDTDQQDLQHGTNEATETAVATVNSPPLIRLRVQNLNFDACIANQDSVGAQLSSATISNGNTAGSTAKKNTTNSAPGRDILRENELVTTSQTKSALETIVINVIDLVCQIYLCC